MGNIQIDKLKYVTNKNLRLAIELDVNGNSYKIRKAKTTFNSTELISSGVFVVKDSLVSLDINFKGNNLRWIPNDIDQNHCDKICAVLEISNETSLKKSRIKR